MKHFNSTDINSIIIIIFIIRFHVIVSTFSQTNAVRHVMYGIGAFNFFLSQYVVHQTFSISEELLFFEKVFENLFSRRYVLVQKLLYSVPNVVFVVFDYPVFGY